MPKEKFNRREFIKKLGVTSAYALSLLHPEVMATTKKIEELLKTKNSQYPFSKSLNTSKLTDHVSIPDGYKRVETNDGFGEWLKDLPILKDRNNVLTYKNKEANFFERFLMESDGIIDMDVFHEWQQCADSILRLKAEYHWSKNEYSKITFNNGKKEISYIDWIKKHKNSRKTFKKYLRYVFGNLGTASMKRDLKKVDSNDIQAGDMNIQNQSGAVGHIFLVLDVVENEKKEKLYLLGQGATPAMEFHIIKLPFASSPWINMDSLQKVLDNVSPYGKGVFRRFSS